MLDMPKICNVPGFAESQDLMLQLSHPHTEVATSPCNHKKMLNAMQRQVLEGKCITEQAYAMLNFMLMNITMHD